MRALITLTLLLALTGLAFFSGWRVRGHTDRRIASGIGYYERFQMWGNTVYGCTCKDGSYGVEAQ